MRWGTILVLVSLFFVLSAHGALPVVRQDADVSINGTANATEPDAAANGTNETATTPVAAPTNETTAAASNGTTAGTPVSVAPVTAGEEGSAWGVLSAGTGAEDGDLDDYDVFARAVTVTGYAGVLSGGTGWNGLTIFAPNDAAFKKTLTALGYTGSDTSLFDALGRVLASQNSDTVLTTLYEIVGYHVVAGGHSPEMLREDPHMAYSGEMLRVEENGTIRDMAAASGIAPPQIVGDPIPVDNAIVYRVDRVLLPFMIDVEKARAVVNAPQGPNCFPAAARVRMADGRMRSVGELKAGDLVQVDGNGAASAVFAFTHRHLYGSYPFVRIRAGASVLTVSDGHYVYANGTPVRADMVRVGDAVLSVDGELQIVKSVDRIHDIGIVAPHTLQGDIVVEDIVVSTYTSLFPRDVAHALLAPVRAIVRAGVSGEPLGSTFYRGMPRPSWPTQARRTSRSLPFQLSSHTAMFSV